MSKQQRYTLEFKAEAVKLVLDQGRVGSRLYGIQHQKAACLGQID